MGRQPLTQALVEAGVVAVPVVAELAALAVAMEGEAPAVEVAEDQVVAAPVAAELAVQEVAMEEGAPVVEELAAPAVVAAAVRAVAVEGTATESVMPQYGVSSWRSPFSMAPVHHR